MSAFPYKITCAHCGAQYEPRKLHNLCTKCGGPLLVVYDFSPAPELRVQTRMRSSTMWRFIEVLPVDDDDEVISIGEGATPMLASRRHANLYIKDESKNPTRSFKSRGMAAAVTMAKNLGAKTLAAPTAGNAGAALSAYGARAGLPVFVAMPRDTPQSIVDECRSYGAEVELVTGVITDAGKRVAKYIADNGGFDLSTLKEPYRVEGKKIMGYELLDDLGRLPDAILYPTGGGTGLIGMWKAFGEMQRLGWIGSERPRMFSVQSSGCAPIVRAFDQKLDSAPEWESPHTSAWGLRVPRAVGDRLMLRALRESNGGRSRYRKTKSKTRRRTCGRRKASTRDRKRVRRCSPTACCAIAARCATAIRSCCSTPAATSTTDGGHMRLVRFAAITIAVLTFTAQSFAQSCPTAGPALLAPANGSTNSPAVMFAWSAVPGATLYRIFTSVNGAPSQQIATSTDNSENVIVAAGAITWYVEADVPNCNPVNSAPGNFTVAQPTCGIGSVTLTAPANASTQQSPVRFNWMPVAGAVGYRVWAGVDTIAPTIVGRSQNTSATLAVPSGAIDWYVEALFNDCPSIFSPHGNFAVSRSGFCGTAPATLIAPTNGATVTAPVTVDWSDVPGAAGYHVWIGTPGGPFIDEGLTTNSFLKLAVNPGDYQWYVDTIYGGCPPVPSAIGTFTVPQPTTTCSGQAPTITAPGEGTTVFGSSVQLAWTAVPNVKQYRVFASLNGGNLQLLGSTNDPALKVSLPFGSVTWLVEATFQGCAATRSAPAHFSIPRATACPILVPTLLSPAKGSTNVTSPATFAWSAVPNAVRYIVVAKAQNGASTVIGDTTSTQIDRDVPAGTITWYVVALGSGCDPDPSAKSTFTVPLPPGCPTRRPHPMAPSEDNTNTASPVQFEWTKTPGATTYKLFAAVDGNEPSLVATSTTNSVVAPMPAGGVDWFVEATAPGCPALFSAVNGVNVAQPAGCTTPDRPQAHVVAQVLSGTSYSVRWTGVANAGSYQIQESASPSFANAQTQTVTGVSQAFNHTAAAPAIYYYRVRAISSCSDDRGAFSKMVATRVVPPNALATKSRATAEVGFDQPIVQTLTVSGTSAFSASTNRPWMTVSPASGTLSPAGTTFTITSDPTTLNVGSNQGAVLLNTTSGTSNGKESNGNTTSTVPVSVSLVTPVSPDTTDSPAPDSLFVPAVVHGPGANNSLFQSDIRVANVSAQAQKYLINFTPSGTDGTQTGTIGTIQVDPGSSVALDDLLSSFYGVAADASLAGMLEIRPLTTSASSTLLSSVPSGALATVASSRTYNVTPLGTFGQFIPAVPFAQFVGQGNILSMQQISQSADNTKGYRTNFGLVEASGQAAQVVLHVYDDAGNHVADIPESLLPSEHLPLNGLLTQNNIALNDGRVEVEVVSSTGKVTAYASVIDNQSNDPLLVSPVLKTDAVTTRSVIPGVAYSNGIANWRSDVRLFNAGTSDVTATLSYYPQGAPGSPLTTTRPVKAGQVVALDNVLNGTFGINDPNAGGSLVVSTQSATPLIASARTYAATNNGTIGQFIPAVTPDGSVGSGDRSLQILQLESSASFRTNIGIAETTGNPVTVEVALNQSDTKITPVLELNLAPNEFTQISLDSFGAAKPVYNARVSVTVTGGAGKVTAYGSLVDNTSSDPTYVPAQ